jgi:predicted pyridoxine 5'-phosphate oxidase superfamily flavin-nucleotide-binding protein
MVASGLKGWHDGELSVQQALGFASAVKDSWTLIEDGMREQHRTFHCSNIPFVPITTIDEKGRPWSAIAAGPTGEPGFIESPDANTLIIRAKFWDGDPFLATARDLLDVAHEAEVNPERYLSAGLGIEFPTRRRNKFAGCIDSIHLVTGGRFEVHLHVTEATGCVMPLGCTFQFVKQNSDWDHSAILSIGTAPSISTFAN